MTEEFAQSQWLNQCFPPEAMLLTKNTLTTNLERKYLLVWPSRKMIDRWVERYLGRRIFSDHIYMHQWELKPLKSVLSVSLKITGPWTRCCPHG
jgi:hypothetical protein